MTAAEMTSSPAGCMWICRPGDITFWKLLNWLGSVNAAFLSCLIVDILMYNIRGNRWARNPSAARWKTLEIQPAMFPVVVELA